MCHCLDCTGTKCLSDLDLVMYLMEVMGKVREVKIGIWIFFSGHMAQNSWMGSRHHISILENSGSKVILAEVITAHVAMSSLACQPQQ